MIKLVKTMLVLGKECGLQTLSESYSNLMLHWDAFFSYANYDEEAREFHEAMKQAGLLEAHGEGDELYYVCATMTIDEALEALNESLRTLQK